MLGETISHYRIIARLGQGGMGVVYIAEDLLLGRRVAIKFSHLSESRHRERFLREARAASALTHPNIARIYDYGAAPGGEPFLVMELVEGETLARQLRRGPLPLARALDIAIAVAEALSQAHQNGIVHRDIKPGNIFLEPDAGVKIIDFGLAKQFGEAPGGGEPTTVEGTIVGTPEYMSPEQARGAELDGRSDLFSLGLVLYACLTGHPAFRGQSTAETLANLIHEPAAPPSAVNPLVPEPLDEVLVKALHKDPAGRYQTAAELARDLRAIRESLQEGDRAETRALSYSDSRTREGRRSSRTPWLAALAVLAVAAGLLWWMRLPRPYVPPRAAERWYSEGITALRDGSSFRATRALARATGLDANFALAHARLAEAWAELEYSDRAGEQMLRALSAAARQRLPGYQKAYLDALEKTLTHDSAGAVAGYREALRLAPESEKAGAWLDLGRAWDRAGNAAEALRSYQQSAAAGPEFAAPYLRMGTLHARRREVDQAEAAFAEAESRYRSLNNIEGIAEVLYQRAVMNSKGGKFDRARELSEQGLRLARDADSPYQQIEFLLQFGTVAALQSPEKADAYVQPALELARRNGIENLATRGLLGLGSTLHMRGKMDQAKALFAEAVDFAARSHATALEKRARLSLASVQADLGDLDTAAATLADILPYFETAGFRSEASRARTLLERIDIARGRYTEALSSAQRLLEAARREKDLDGQAYAQSDIAEALLDLDRYPEALGPARQAGEVRANQHSGVQLGYVLQIAVDAQARLGRFPEAAQTLQEAERAADGNAALRALLRLAQARLLQFRGDWAGTRAAVRAVAGDRAADPAVSGQAKALLALAVAHAGGGAGAVRACSETAAAIAGDVRARQLALLDCAEAEWASGNTRGAAAHALALRGDLERNAQYALLWRALAIAAAAQRSFDPAQARQSAASANAAWEQLRGRFGEPDMQTFASRPDARQIARWLSALH